MVLLCQIKEFWTIIFNKNWKQHGKDEYNQADDVFRFDVKPKISRTESKENLTYRVEKIGNQQGAISLSWGKNNNQFSIFCQQTENLFHCLV